MNYQQQKQKQQKYYIKHQKYFHQQLRQQQQYSILIILWTILIFFIETIWTLGEEKFLKGLIIGLLFAQNKRQESSSSYTSSYHYPMYSPYHHYR